MASLQVRCIRPALYHSRGMSMNPKHPGRRPGWLLGDSVRSLWHSYRRQVAPVSGRDWGIWASILVLGFGACSVLVFLTTQLGKALVGQGLQTWDGQVLRTIVAHAPMAFADAIMYESPGNLLYIAPLIIVALVIAIRRQHALAGMSLLIGYVLQRPLVIFGWMWWDRNRPDFIAGGVAAPGFHSFPSGHAAMSTFVYGFLAYLWARATPHVGERLLAFALAIAWILLISVGRLRLGSHWPSDMLAGYVIAAAWLGVVIVAHRRLEHTGAGA